MLCSGNISDIIFHEDGEIRDADITFDQESAARTALLLNHVQLGPKPITVTSKVDPDADHEKPVAGKGGDSQQISQEEKPRARILAEYLAQGYVVSDAAVQRALDLDRKHGMADRFLATLQNLDSKYQATERAKAVDESYGISRGANSLFNSLGSYFETASNQPIGQQIVKFYAEASNQVQQVHAEARRLADLRENKNDGSAYKAAGLDRVFGEKESSNKNIA